MGERTETDWGRRAKARERNENREMRTAQACVCVCVCVCARTFARSARIISEPERV